MTDPAPLGVGGRYACSICRSERCERVCEKEGTHYVRCSDCGVIRQYPYPTESELVEFYEGYQTRKSQNSSYLTDEGYQAYCRDKSLTFADLGIPPAVFAGKRICDVGCGTGQFLQFAQQFAPAQALGLDLSEECVQSGRSRGLDVRRDDFLALRETFDVVSMWHVVEHLLSPRKFLEHACRTLSPGGSLLIETPVTGPVSDAFGEGWRFYMPVEHVNLFSPRSLVELCRESGFDLKASVRFGSGNDAGTAQPRNKRAMDILVKSLGCGDTMAAWFVKR